MPVFGARMVCEAGNYRQVQERHRAELEREIKLGKWLSEKSQRKAALRELQELTTRAESIKTGEAKSSSPSDSPLAPLEVCPLRPDGRRRSNSLVTELVSEVDSVSSHLSPLDLLRMESCGNILERIRRRGSDSPGPSKLVESPSRHQSAESVCEEGDKDND